MKKSAICNENIDIQISKGSQEIISTLEKAGFEAYVVGGCVRDSIVGNIPKDWDICTNARPEQVKICFSFDGSSKKNENYDGDFKVIETGIQHGTLTIWKDGEPFEVTTYRDEGEYLDNRRPSKVNFIELLREDLARRDFTINAMAYNPKIGIADYFGGIDDLKNNLVKCVGNADKRFREDSLRIMRALRFAATFGFDIEADTDKSIRSNKELLNNIATERINIEFSKLICGRGAGKILRQYRDVTSVFIPELSEYTIKAIDLAKNDIIIRLSVLFHQIGLAPLKLLKYDNNTIKAVEVLVEYHDKEIIATEIQVKGWLNKIGELRFRQLLEVKRALVMAQKEPEDMVMPNDECEIENINKVIKIVEQVILGGKCYSLKDLAVKGGDLVEIGMPEGAIIGKTLELLLDLVINGEVENEHKKLLNVVKNVNEN